MMDTRAMNRTRCLLLTCASLLMLDLHPYANAQVAPRPDFANTIAKARETAWKAITSGQGSAVTVAIMERGKLAYSEVMGVADRAQNRAVDRNTRFNIGSVSKMFAAVAILMLVDEGKVDLDAPVFLYIPEFTMADARYRDITVRMLVNHSSGLPGTTAFIGFEPDTSTHGLLLETMRHSVLKHAPGAMSMYTNDGFTLVEMIIERRAGRKYVDFLVERIFAPLGMRHTGASLGEIVEGNVAEYYEAKSGKKYPREVVPMYATGGLSSTAEDLCRFGDSFMPYGKALLSPASLREIMRPQPTPFADKLRESQEFGEFGWDYAKRIGAMGTLVLAKGGNTGFYSGNLQILPAERIVIALITSGKASGDKLTEPILAGLLQDRRMAVQSGVARPAESQPIPAALDRYAGHYVMESGLLKVSIDSSRHKLVLTPMAGGTPPSALTYSDGYFYGPHPDTRYYFGTAAGQDFIVASVVGLTGFDTVVFQKLEPVHQPLALGAPMRDELWLIRNAPRSMELFEDQNVMVTSHSYDELPGYVDFKGVRKIERADYAGMAATMLRDQTDLALVPGDGGTWVRTGHILRSAATAAPRLDIGAAVTIGGAGFNEWRAVGQGAALRFVLPDNRGRVIVVTPDSVLHDNLVDGNDVYAPAGSYIFFAGAAGDTFGIHEIPAP
jgi:CubicO group peptidase (beta-lactamase class C family)